MAMTNEQMKQAVMRDGISSGEWNVYVEWFETGRGYEANRETIDRVDAAIAAIDPHGEQYPDVPMRPVRGSVPSDNW